MKKANKNKFEKKITSYSALAAGVIAIGSTANAQIIYTDVNPDKTISDSIYMLDINNDDTMDFQIIHSYNTSFGNLDMVGIYASNSNEILGINEVTSSGSTYFLPLALNNNETISAGQATWNSYSGSTMPMNMSGTFFGYPIQIGNWKNANDKYLGIKFKISGNWHYGWARFDVDNNAKSFTIKDYAYESHPGKKILAGMEVSGIAENELLSKIRIYSYNKKVIVDLQEDKVHKANLKVFNIMGKEVRSVEINGRRQEISLEELNSGIYLITLITEDGKLTKKIRIN